MSHATSNGTPFGERLRYDLETQGVSIKELGRRLNPETPEDGRRQLHRYLSGEVSPGNRRRIAIALALGFERDHYDRTKA